MSDYDINTTQWTLNDAVKLITEIEALAPECGCHVALTGGVLYKSGPRKDLDIMLYQIRQAECIDWPKLRRRLEKIGIMFGGEYGWVVKATYQNRNIDFLFPNNPINLIKDAHYAQKRP